MHPTSIEISPIRSIFPGSFICFDLFMGLTKADRLHEKASEWWCHRSDRKCGRYCVIRREGQVVLEAWKGEKRLVEDR